MQEIPDHLDVEVDGSEQLLRAQRSAVPGRATARAPRARATVRVETRASDVLTQVWGWRELRDYVIRMGQDTHGQLIKRDPLVESGIFKGFVKRHGAVDAQRIARYVFEQAPRPGYFLGAPVRPGKFTEIADEAFALPILEKINNQR